MAVRADGFFCSSFVLVEGKGGCMGIMANDDNLIHGLRKKRIKHEWKRLIENRRHDVWRVNTQPRMICLVRPACTATMCERWDACDLECLACEWMTSAHPLCRTKDVHRTRVLRRGQAREEANHQS